jgi:thioredoxin-like negative regulator of GroEL
MTGLDLKGVVCMSSLAATLILQAAFLTSAPAASSLNYRDAYAEAQDSKRPLMIVIGADWCQACVDLKQSTIPEMQKVGKLDGVVLTYIDLDRDPELARQLLGGPSIPQVILFSQGEAGWTRKQLTGRQSSDSLASLVAPAVNIAKGAASKTKTPSTIPSTK